MKVSVNIPYIQHWNSFKINQEFYRYIIERINVKAEYIKSDVSNIITISIENVLFLKFRRKYIIIIKVDINDIPDIMLKSITFL